MRPFYRTLLLGAVLATVGASSSYAQEYTECPTNQDECLVEYGTFQDPILNALRNTIANDTDRPEGRVYVLERSGAYYNTDPIVYDGFDLRIVGQDAPTDGSMDFGPAILQRVANPETGTAAPGVMIQAGTGSETGETTSGLVLRNLWIQGETGAGGTGAYEPIVINSANSRIVVDNVVFDQNDWHHMAFKAPGNTIVYRNNTFRNQSGTGQQYIGRGFRIEQGADSLIVENNSFFNISSFPFQAEVNAVDYVLFNHNTLVNFGLGLASGNIWKEAFFANNLMVNPFYQGEGTLALAGEDRESGQNPSGIFNIEDLPAGQGLEADRRIAFVNNAVYYEPELLAIHGRNGILTQTLVSDSTLSYTTVEPYATASNGQPAIVIDDNVTGQDPMLGSSPADDPDVLSQIEAFIQQTEADAGGNNQTAVVFWDPVAPGTPGADNPLFVNFPVPEDFSYTNATLLSAGTDDLPVGDLNWFPGAKSEYLANRESYVQDIVDLTGAPPREVAYRGTIQAERGMLGDGATIAYADGLTYFETRGGGQKATYTFNVPSAGTYGIDIVTNLNGQNPRGLQLIVDADTLVNQQAEGNIFYCTGDYSNGGETRTCEHPVSTLDEFFTYSIRQGDLYDRGGTPDSDESQALTLEAGDHTLVAENSWGYFYISDINIVDGGGT